MSSPNVIHVLTGCTAVGKTQAALQWAEANAAEIVSCDSLLFYRGMDIGTAKPSKAELARVPHHLIDICEPTAPMDIARYVDLAREIVKSLTTRGRPVLVTGGSGFYLKAFFGPVVDKVTVPDAVRRRVASLTLEAAVDELQQRNPSGLGSLDTANPRRVSRALERCIASDLTLKQLRSDFAAQPRPFSDYEVKLVELIREPAELEIRIRLRVVKMIEQGLVLEVERLLQGGLHQNASAVAAIGYREVRKMLEGKLSPNEMVEEIVRNTRTLVKKQRTWFRTQLPRHAQLPAEGIDIDRLFATD